MPQKTVSVIGAVELELTEARGILERLTSKVGREEAENTFFDDLNLITMQNMMQMAQGDGMTLAQRIKSIALSILGIEILTENELHYEE